MKPCFTVQHNRGRHNCFDFIDANRFIPYINENQKIIQSRAQINYKGKPLEMTTLDNFMLEWTAKYYTFINGKRPDSQ
jgi:hypothetical protein